MTTITLKRDKETKNKIRFSNDPSEPISGSLYVSKEAAGDKQSLTINVPVDLPVAA
jgi:hypothetical protein